MGSPLRNSILSRNNRQFFPTETGFFGTDLEENFFCFYFEELYLDICDQKMKLLEARPLVDFKSRSVKSVDLADTYLSPD